MNASEGLLRISRVFFWLSAVIAAIAAIGVLVGVNQFFNVIDPPPIAHEEAAGSEFIRDSTEKINWAATLRNRRSTEDTAEGAARRAAKEAQRKATLARESAALLMGISFVVGGLASLIAWVVGWVIAGFAQPRKKADM